MTDFSTYAGKWVAVDAELNVLLASDDFGEVCRVEGARVLYMEGPKAGSVRQWKRESPHLLSR